MHVNIYILEMARRRSSSRISYILPGKRETIQAKRSEYTLKLENGLMIVTSPHFDSYFKRM